MTRFATRSMLALAVLAALPSLAHAQQKDLAETTADGGHIFHLQTGDLKITVVSPTILHIQFAKDPAAFGYKSFAVIPPTPPKLPANLVPPTTLPNDTIQLNPSAIRTNTTIVSTGGAVSFSTGK